MHRRPAALTWPSTVLTALCALFIAGCSDITEPRPEPEVAEGKGGKKGNQDLMRMVNLGSNIFSDTDLSFNRNQSCKSCHNPDWGWTGADPSQHATEGPNHGTFDDRFGGRKAMSAAYASQAPEFERRTGLNRPYIGGNFWDGRGTGGASIFGGMVLTPIEDQAQRPFVNPVEMALRDEACVVRRIATSRYADDYVEVFGDAILDIAFPAHIDDSCEAQEAQVDGEGNLLRLDLDGADGPDLPTDATWNTGVRGAVNAEYDNIAHAIGTMFEDSKILNAFSSDYDEWRETTSDPCTDRANLSKEAHRGMVIFSARNGGTGPCDGVEGLPDYLADVPGGSCNSCHENPLDLDVPFIGTDFEFDNIGVAPNPDNPGRNLAVDGPDLGLGGFLASIGNPWGDADQWKGAFRVPTVRNTAKGDGFGRTYMHNGVLKSLVEVVHFYNTARAPAEAVNCSLVTYQDALGPNCWAEPEVAEGRVPPFLVGDLGLSPEDEAAVLAFLRALTDAGTRGPPR